jgi:hypothetical protein
MKLRNDHHQTGSHNAPADITDRRAAMKTPEKITEKQLKQLQKKKRRKRKDLPENEPV